MANERVSSSTSTTAGTDREPSLLPAILRRRKRVVLITTAVTVLATVGLTLQQTKIYTATADVVVQAPPAQSPTEPNMATEAQIARSLAVARVVERELEILVPPSDLLGQLAVHVPADSEVLKFTYSSPFPGEAQARAQAFARAYVTIRRRQFENQILTSATSTAERIQVMSSKLSTLRRQIAGAAGARGAPLRVQRDALTSEIALLRQELAELNGAVASFSPATLLGAASFPRSPARPKLPVNVFIALLGGLMLGFGIAAIAEYADPRVRGASDLDARLGAPVLGQISIASGDPDRPAPTLVAIDAPASESAVAFRRLRTNVAAGTAETGARSVAITSIDADDIPIEFAANLAAVLATAGKRVVLLSPRRGERAVAALLGARPGPGFFDAVAGTISIAKVVSTTGIDNLFFCSHGASDPRAARETESGLPHVTAVASATETQSLGTDRAVRLIDDLAATADLVLVDAPPLLTDPDGAVVAGACDGVLAVARSTTRREDVQRAREQFERVRARLLGSVLLTGTPRRSRLVDSLGSRMTTTDDTKNKQQHDLGDQRPSNARRQRTLGATGGETQ